MNALRLSFALVITTVLLLRHSVANAADSAPKTLTPADNLIVDGIPPIPAEMPDEVGRYTESRAAALQDWHPTRPEMLITTRFGDTNQIHRLIQPGGARTQLTFFPDRVDGGSFEPTKGDYFIFSKGAGGNEFNQNYRYDFADGQITLLTDGKSRNSGPVWSNTGERIVYTSTRRNGADTDIYLESPADPKSDRMLAELKGGGWDPMDWSPDDKQLIVLEEISINESYLWLIDTQTGEKKAVTPRPPEGAEKVAYSAAVFSKDGKGVFTTTDRESEFQRLAYIDLASGKHTYLMPDVKWDVDSWDLSHDGKQIAYALNENGVSTLHLIDLVPGNGTVTARPQKDPTFDPPLPAVVITGLRWHRDPKQGLLAFNVAGARSPSDVYTWSIAGGKNTTSRWTASETGGIPATRFVEPELIRWKSFDGKEITGFLYAPDAAKFPGPRPVIVNIHGGPEDRPAWISGAEQLLHQRARLRDSLSECSWLGRLRENFPETGQRFQARRLLQGYLGLARLGWNPVRPRFQTGHGHGRLLRRVHDAGGRIKLRRSNPLRAGCGRAA